MSGAPGRRLGVVAIGVAGGIDVRVSFIEEISMSREANPRRRLGDAGLALGFSRGSARDALDLRSQVLVLLRQHERLSEMGRVLVPGEAGLVGGDLEQHPARRAEVDRPEIVAVDGRRHLVARVDERLAHLGLRGPVRDREGDVMHRASALPGVVGAGQRLDIDDVGAVALRLHGVARQVAAPVNDLVIHELQEFARRRAVAQPQRHAAETMDALGRGNRPLGEGRARVILDANQRQAVAIRTQKAQVLLAEDIRSPSPWTPAFSKRSLQ